jgi:hypothetical protein
VGPALLMVVIKIMEIIGLFKIMNSIECPLVKWLYFFLYNDRQSIVSAGCKSKGSAKF